MFSTKKDKIIAAIFVILFFGAWIGLAWLTKTGGFQILADVLVNGL